jgi:cytochrome c oxidase subunit 4
VVFYWAKNDRDKIRRYLTVGLFNVGSIALGLVAWMLPIVSLMRFKKKNNDNWAILSIMSISACAVSLFFQINYNNHLVRIEDWSALMDTTGAVVFVSGVLLVVTLLLNLVTVVVYRTEKNHNKKNSSIF